MRIQTVKFFSLLLIFAVTLATSQGAVDAQETATSLSTGAAEPGTGSSMTISDLVSSSTGLSGRLSALQKRTNKVFVDGG